jgi:hypothetical protein
VYGRLESRVSLQAELPSVGTFARARGGRVRFAFDACLLAFFETNMLPVPPLHALRAVTPCPDAMRPASAASAAAPQRSRPTSAAAGSREPPTFLHGADTVQRRELAHLHALCADADPARGRFVKRLQLERWLHRECRELVGRLSGAAVLDLLQAHAYGANLQRSISHECTA